MDSWLGLLLPPGFDVSRDNGLGGNRYCFQLLCLDFYAVDMG